MIGVGIIGLSAERGWAARGHVPALAALPGFELVAASASSPSSATAAAAAHGVERACRDHRELVSLEEVDLVVVAVKVPNHRELVGAAIEAGKDVLCEWPLGNGVAEAEEMAALADRHGVRGFAGLQARSLPAIRFLRELVDGGELGELRSTTLLGCGPTWGPTVTPDGLYQLDRRSGATMLTIPFGHTLDALCFCLGEVVEVAATIAALQGLVTRVDTGEQVPSDAEDQVAIAGRLQGGAVIAAHYRGGVPPTTPLYWEIEGTKATVVVSGPTGHIQFGDFGMRIAVAGGDQLEPLEVPAGYEEVEIPFGRAYAVAQQYARLYRDLTEGGERVPTFADAVARHETIAAIETAAASGLRQV